MNMFTSEVSTITSFGVSSSNLRWTKFLCLLIGLGVNGQTILHWIFFIIQFVHIIVNIFHTSEDFEPEIQTFNYLFSDSFQLATLFILLIKRNEIQEFIKVLNSLIDDENQKYIKILDALIGLFCLIYFIGDASLTSILIAEFTHLSSNETITFNEVLEMIEIVHSAMMNNWLNILTGLYILCFTLLYFIKCQSVENLANMILFDRKPLAMSTLISLYELNDSFESCFSIIPFSSLSWSFVATILIVNLLLHDGNDTEIIKQRFLTNLFSTISISVCTIMMLVASILQEISKNKGSKLCDLVGYKSESAGDSVKCHLIIQKINEAYGNRATVWKLCEIERGIVFTMGSSFLSFIVLFFQLNNGGLMGETSSQKNVTTATMDDGKS